MSDKLKKFIQSLVSLKNYSSFSFNNFSSKANFFIDKHRIIKKMYIAGTLFVMYLIYEDLKIHIQLKLVDERIVERTNVLEERLANRKKTLLQIAKEEGLWYLP